MRQISAILFTGLQLIEFYHLIHVLINEQFGPFSVCIDILRLIDIKFVAVSVKNLLILDLVLGLVLPSIIIPPLTGIPNEHNRNETLRLTPTQASWLGKSPIQYLNSLVFKANFILL